MVVLEDWGRFTKTFCLNTFATLIKNHKNYRNTVVRDSSASLAQ